jgi:hypothetical protein
LHALLPTSDGSENTNAGISPKPLIIEIRIMRAEQVKISAELTNFKY